MSETARLTKKRANVGAYDAIILIVFLLYGLISQYTLLCGLAGLTFVVILKSLWREYTPPVLLFFMFLHWVQVFSSILFADFVGSSIDELFNSRDTAFLFGMTFLQIILVIVFLRGFVAKKIRKITPSLAELTSAAEQLNLRSIIIGYFASAFIVPVLQSFTFGSASLFQLISSFGIIKLIFIGLLVFMLLLKKKTNKPLILAILAFDFIMSFASYFSDFKIIIFILIVVYFTVKPYLSKNTILRVIPVVVLISVFLSFWSYVKGDYRDFLNQGTRSQVQNVSSSMALSYLADKSSNFGFDELKEGFAVLLSRAQYMERYSEVYARVPAVIPHTDGRELYDAIQFVLIPRFLNKNKGIKDASEKTSYYTGIRFSNAAQGTSISMGYFCELYIDFGLYIMIIPLILIAVMIGYIYTWVLGFKYNILLVYSIMIGFFLMMGMFESDMIFFFGMLRNNVAFLVLGVMVIFPFINKFITKKN